MQDQLIREMTTPAECENATQDREPGFIDCRGRWQTLVTPTEAF